MRHCSLLVALNIESRGKERVGEDEWEKSEGGGWKYKKEGERENGGRRGRKVRREREEGEIRGKVGEGSGRV